MTTLADELEVLEATLAWLTSGHQVAWVTTIKTWGSSPRPPGSLLAMNNAGQFVGSVSGGCVEETLLGRYRAGELAGPTPTRVDFGVDRLEATRMGLPCGGRLEVLIEQITEPDSIKQLLEKLRNGELVARRVDLSSGEAQLLPGNGDAEFQVSATALTKIFGPTWQLLLIGDGQLARHLASMALHLNYQVIICDPREDFAHPAPLAEVCYRHEMPDEVIQGLRAQARTAIVTLTHDPRQDDVGLSAALESQAFYIGALGSTRSAQARRERLASLGYSPEQIQRIQGPAGLPIGSKQPAEIAVSILAQMISTRNGITQAVAQNT